MTLQPSDLDRYKDLCISRRLSDEACRTAALVRKQLDETIKCQQQIVGGGPYWDRLPKPEATKEKSARDWCDDEWLKPCADARDAAIKKCPPG